MRYSYEKVRLDEFTFWSVARIRPAPSTV
jgi:hypothetical protein